MPAERNAYLAEHNRLTMTLDYNLAIMHPQLAHIISIIRPKLEVAMKNMTVEYVYAVLAALARLPDEKGKSLYLEHQRRYLTGLALVESTYLRQGIDTCVESFRLFTDIHLDALDRISNLFRLMHRSAQPPCVRGTQPTTHDADEVPEEIPEGIRSFLGSAIDLPTEYISDFPLPDSSGRCNIFQPPDCCFPRLIIARLPVAQTQVCFEIKMGCLKLLYTLSDGACPTFVWHLTCSDCKVRCYPNYIVQDEIRTYYDKIPDAIEVGKHQYVEQSVLNLFINLMLISWTSATNGARVYDNSLSRLENFPDHPDWMDTSFKLRPEHVWDGFILLALLEDHAARSTTLR
ncbi:hypothetical protein B0H13DRAFT_2319921 [Mycena leptocephala]|nr:hypothetical protein B0H13DRAFT_2319921 [Mycena leptocephala]